MSHLQKFKPLLFAGNRSGLFRSGSGCNRLKGRFGRVNKSSNREHSRHCGALQLFSVLLFAHLVEKIVDGSNFRGLGLGLFGFGFSCRLRVGFCVRAVVGLDDVFFQLLACWRFFRSAAVVAAVVGGLNL